jgi:hypothetical protein
MCTMVARKSSIQLVSDDRYEQQLLLLYARRIAIDDVIRSLTDYERCRKQFEVLKEKSA